MITIARTQASLDKQAADERAELEALVREEGARRMRLARAEYTDEEVDTWDRQAAQADLYYSSGGTASVPLLEAMALANGTTVAGWADRISAKDASYQAAIGLILGKQDVLLAMDPIPSDYTDDTHWT